MDTFIELGAGKVIAGLIKRVDRKVPCHSVGDAESLQKTLDALSAAGYPLTNP